MFLRYSLRHLCVCSLSLMRLQSDFMLHLNQIRNLLIAEKLYLHSADVTANAQPILGKSNIFENFCLSQTLMAFALDGRFCTGTSNHFVWRYKQKEC